MRNIAICQCQNKLDLAHTIDPQFFFNLACVRSQHNQSQLEQIKASAVHNQSTSTIEAMSIQIQHSQYANSFGGLASLALQSCCFKHGGKQQDTVGRV